LLPGLQGAKRTSPGFTFSAGFSAGFASTFGFCGGSPPAPGGQGATGGASGRRYKGTSGVVVEVLVGHGDTAVVVDFLCGHGVVLDTSGEIKGISLVFTIGANTSSIDGFVGKTAGRGVVLCADRFVSLAVGKAAWVVLGRPKICSHAETPVVLLPGVVEVVVNGVVCGIVALSGGVGVCGVELTYSPRNSQALQTEDS